MVLNNRKRVQFKTMDMTVSMHVNVSQWLK